MIVPPKVSTLSRGRTDIVSRDARHRIALTGSALVPPSEGLRSLERLMPELSLPPMIEPYRPGSLPALVFCCGGDDDDV